MMQAAAQAADSFFDFKLANYLTLAGIVIAYLSYHLSSKRREDDRKKEWKSLVEEQATRHAENRMRFETLIRFQSNQEGVNLKRDEQVHQLSIQTTTIAEMAKGLTFTIAEMAKGFNRRLEMLEDK